VRNMGYGASFRSGRRQDSSFQTICGQESVYCQQPQRLVDIRHAFCQILNVPAHVLEIPVKWNESR
jgi:hypothetical protein